MNFSTRSVSVGLGLLGCLLLGTALSVRADKGPKIVRLPGVENAVASRAVAVEELPLVHTAQLFPAKTEGTVEAQIKGGFERLEAVLKAAGSSGKQVVKLNVYGTNAAVLAQAETFLGEYFDKGSRPAVCAVAGSLAEPGAAFALDAVAISKFSESGVRLTPQAGILPKGGAVYVSGQAEKGELAAATRATLDKLKATLAELDLTKEDIVQAKAFVRPMGQAGVAQKEFDLFFEGRSVPVVLVDWVSGDVPIEIELVAARGSKAMGKTGDALAFYTPSWMKSSPVYAKVVCVQAGARKIYVGGLNGKTADNAEAEVKEIFAELGDILEQTGSDWKHLAKATYYVSNPQTSAKLNDLRPRYYDPERPPAASKAMVRDLGKPGRGITVDMIAVVPEK